MNRQVASRDPGAQAGIRAVAPAGAARGPVLVTPRLRLRPPAEADFLPLRAFVQSERSRFTGGRTDDFGVWQAVLASIGHWALRGYGFFTVEVAEGDGPVGRAGVIRHFHHAEPELAWQLFAGFEGRGYATEAASAVRDWFGRTIAPAPLMSFIDPSNHASERVAERLGAKLEAPRLLSDGRRVNIWRHIATGGIGR